MEPATLNVEPGTLNPAESGNLEPGTPLKAVTLNSGSAPMHILDIQKLKIIAEPLAKAFQLKLMVLFGSAARGRLRADSDIDIGIVTESPIFEDPSLYSEFMAGLEKIEHEFKRGIDCVEINSQTIPLLSQILKDGVVLYECNPGFYSIQKLHWRFLVEDNWKYTLNYPKILERKLKAL